VLLAAKAAIKTGCGLVTAFVPNVDMKYSNSHPEVMVITDVAQRYLSDIKQIKPQAIGIGPGIGKRKQQKHCIGF
jgi:NAD(P)H-hydrate repair Nnr-like enzyme with NAD(P)H-hydrate dehydratase domain